MICSFFCGHLQERVHPTALVFVGDDVSKETIRSGCDEVIATDSSSNRTGNRRSHHHNHHHHHHHQLLQSPTTAPSLRTAAAEHANTYQHHGPQTPWIQKTVHQLSSNDPRLTNLVIDTDEQQAITASCVCNLLGAMSKNGVLRNIRFKSIDFGEATCMQYLLPTLRRNTSIQLIELESVGSHVIQAVAAALSNVASLLTAALSPSSSSASSSSSTSRAIPPSTTMPTNSSIHSIVISDARMDLSTAEAIACLLKANSQLSTLRITNCQFAPDSFVRIANALQWNDTVRCLDLLGNHLDDKDITSICEATSNNRGIEYLCLDFNAFGLEGVRSIANLLTRNTKLSELQLFGNNITARGAIVLADALRHNRSLRTLILSLNQIGDEGAAAIADALMVNTTLAKLWCPANGIGNAGLEAFGRCLPQMRGLQQLNLGDFFDNRAVQSMLDGLRLNLQLSVLYLESPAYDDEYLDRQIQFYLQLNKCGRRMLLDARLPHYLWAKVLERAQRKAEAANMQSSQAVFCLLREKPEIFARMQALAPRE